MKMKLPPTVTREMLISESECALVRMMVKAGTIPPLHAHPQAQIDYMISGSADVSVDGIITHLEPGDSIYIPGGVTHGFLVSDEDQEFLEFFTPGRDDLE